MDPGYTSPITLQLVGPQSWTEVPALLCYDAADPFAVRIAFGDVGDENGVVDLDDGGIAWLLSRELLQAGLDAPAGDGDVRLWPAHAATDVLFLHLRAPPGRRCSSCPGPPWRPSSGTPRPSCLPGRRANCSTSTTSFTCSSPTAERIPRAADLRVRPRRRLQPGRRDPLLGRLGGVG
ncbi:SsgA family sporulation/cell division regulator [Blastococcus brunescens]|uniref:SsgA family sporulation/cell division regulator n=1 Tax=Blastococcus brunescens TaxID=1564165 RepID=A0ABZ1B5U0_9ACTN|nr:SsgA family sporulation/cell division regulator [Blastococcus sp. BMG 8361]WRL66161.1 SsgA family sporulation/cell division regulator [Blastococcus sp. BMG 8361]